MAAQEQTKTTVKSIQVFPELTKESFSKISLNLRNTGFLGITVGVFSLVGFSLTLKGGGMGLLSLFLIISAASFISGFFLGFLFGIPKRNPDTESAYILSTNLVDISDWLTKIIIGLGLIEIKRIPGYLQSVGQYIQQAVGGTTSITIFSVASITYFTVFGLYFAYNYMRLYLSGQFKEADDFLLQKQEELDKTREKLTSTDLTPENLSSAKKDISEYNKLVKITKSEEDYSFEDWYFRGLGAYDKKEYNKAIVYMQNALEKNRNAEKAPDAYLYIGLAYYSLTLYDKAIEADQNIIDNYPNYENMYIVYSNNGSYYEAKKQWQDALRSYDEALKLKPTDLQSWNNKGYVLRMMERLKDSYEAINEALRLDPKYPYAWYNKSCLHALQKEKEDMLSSLKRAIELDPGYKNAAATDEAFDAFKDDPDFKKVIE